MIGVRRPDSFNADSSVHASPGFGEQAFAVLVLLTSTTTTLRFTAQPSLAGESNPATFGVWIVFYVISLLLAFPRRNVFVRVVLSNGPIVALVVFALASTLWSAEPQQTFRRAIALGATCIVGWYFAVRYRPLELLHLLAVALALAAIGSVVLVAATPFGVELPMPGVGAEGPYAGAWRGIYVTKNALAQVMALATLILPLAAISARRGALLFWGAFVVATVELAYSMSATGLLVALTLLVSVGMLALVRRNAYAAILLAAGGLLASAMVFVTFDVGIDDLLALVGRDRTLTGRTDLWSAVVDMIREHPWVGWGHGAFWLDWRGEGSRYVLMRAGWNAGYAHNGYLDLALGLGLTGVGLLLWAQGRIGQLSWRWARSSDMAVGLWAPGVLIFLVLANIAEGGIVQQNYYNWLLFVTIAGLIKVWTPEGLLLQGPSDPKVGTRMPSPDRTLHSITAQ